MFLNDHRGMVLLKPFILFQPDRFQLSGLELRDGQVSPRLRDQEDGGVHEFQERLFTKIMRNDLGPPTPSSGKQKKQDGDRENGFNQRF